MEPKDHEQLQANFSTLVISIGSQAAVHLGLAPNPSNGKKETNKQLAQFNIDLLIMLQTKTASNLDEKENQFLKKMIQDLQLQFVNI